MFPVIDYWLSVNILAPPPPSQESQNYSLASSQTLQLPETSLNEPFSPIGGTANVLAHNDYFDPGLVTSSETSILPLDGINPDESFSLLCSM